MVELGYCRPRKETILSICSICTIGFKPTQKWKIIGRDNGRWTIKRHNIVASFSENDFLKYFYRAKLR